MSSTPTAPVPNRAMVVSVSSDGQFALSSHEDNRLFLWDLDKKTNTIISENANIYSAYFVQGVARFAWQDLDGNVFIQNVGGDIEFSFHHLPVSGHLISSDLHKYFSSDVAWAIHARQDGRNLTIKQGGGRTFAGAGKLLNLDISRDGRYLLMSGYGYDFENNYTLEQKKLGRENYKEMVGVVLWNAQTLEPMFILPGNSAKVTATLSPGGEYVVSGCENGIGLVWETNTGHEYLRLASLFHGLLNKNGSDDFEKWTRDKTGLIPTPDDLNSRAEATIAIGFIDENHYLRFLTRSPYAVLYNIHNPLPLKYLFLGRDPLPAVNDYSRNAAIDTAPEAGVLVMGQQNGGGIIVYKYDSESQELERIWVSE